MRKDNHDAIFGSVMAAAGKVILTNLSWFMSHPSRASRKLAFDKTIQSKASIPVGY